MVVCLTDSDAAPDVHWVEEMWEAQRGRRAAPAGRSLGGGEAVDQEVYDEIEVR